MVYIYVGTVNNFIDITQMATKYPLVNEHRTSVQDFIYLKFERRSVYQRLGKKFLRICKKCMDMALQFDDIIVSFNDFLQQKCVKDTKMFAIYAKYNLDNFKCCKFLEQFFGKPIVSLVDWMSGFHMVNDIPLAIQSNQAIYTSIKNILTIHMMFTMAQVCSIIDLAMKSATLEALRYIYFHCSDDKQGCFCPFIYVKINNTIARHLMNNTDIGTEISDPIYSDLMKTILYAVPLMPNTVIDVITNMYEHSKKLYVYFIDKTTQEIINICTENPDINAMIGGYLNPNRKITKLIIAEHISKINNYLLIDLLDDAILCSLNDKTTQIKDLVMPYNNMDKKKIIIEV
jgi:hypothetical protein